jgi:hypothetical protein
MLRYLLAVVLVSCAAPASVNTTPAPEPSARSSVPATTTPIATATRSPTPDPASLARCAAQQLQAIAAGVMGADLFVGAVFFANRGNAPCTLRGNPEVVFLAKDGSPLDIRLAAASGGAPTLVVVPVSEFRQDPAGIGGAGATAPLQWSNYCDDVLAVGFRVTLPDSGGVVDGTFVDLSGRPVAAFGTPRCDDASGTSTLTVYPLQEPR